MPPNKPPREMKRVIDIDATREHRQGSRPIEPREDDGIVLPPLIDGVISFFEGFNAERVTFSFGMAANNAPCTFCMVPTKLRMSVNRAGEDLKTVICHDCKSAIGSTPTP